MPLQDVRDDAGAGNEPAEREIHEKQHGRRDQSSQEAVVGPDHRVLHGVGDQENQDEIEGGHLADLALARQPQTGEHEEIDDEAADEDLRDGCTEFPQIRERHDSIRF